MELKTQVQAHDLEPAKAPEAPRKAFVAPELERHLLEDLTAETAVSFAGLVGS